MLQVTDLVKEFPLRSGVLRRVNGSVRAVDEVSLQYSSRDDPGPGRRERLGQVDPGPGGPPPHRPDGGDDRRRRQGHHLAPGAAAASAPGIDADGLPGPLFVARSQAEHRRHRRRAPGHPHVDEQGRTGTAGRGAPVPGRTGFPRPVTPAARVLRRATPAHRHRAGAGPRAPAAGLRRAGQRARRLHAVAGHQPAHRAADANWASPISSSPTICRSSVTSATGSP